MMTGYRGQPGKTREAEWRDGAGNRFIRTGDVGRFDEDGFLILIDRRKDMIISGGFNVYPSDIEAALAEHAQVAEAAVVGAPSAEWGETPVAFVALREGASLEPEELRAWVNAASRQDAAPCRAQPRRRLAAQRDRQGAEAGIARAMAGAMTAEVRFNLTIDWAGKVISVRRVDRLRVATPICEGNAHEFLIAPTRNAA